MPQPVSVTAKWASSPFCSRLKVICPCFVNLEALTIRLIRTCCKREESVSIIRESKSERNRISACVCFIFSIVCEELGYVGAIAILILFALLICRGYWIAAHSPDRYSFLVGIGITTLLSIQVFLNIAVVTNLIPCTGISLPFFSYGGTALLMQLGEMGIILSISRDIPTKKAR